MEKAQTEKAAVDASLAEKDASLAEKDSALSTAEAEVRLVNLILSLYRHIF